MTMWLFGSEHKVGPTLAAIDTADLGFTYTKPRADLLIAHFAAKRPNRPDISFAQLRHRVLLAFQGSSGAGWLPKAIFERVIAVLGGRHPLKVIGAWVVLVAVFVVYNVTGRRRAEKGMGNQDMNVDVTVLSLAGKCYTWIVAFYILLSDCFGWPAMNASRAANPSEVGNFVTSLVTDDGAPFFCFDLWRSICGKLGVHREIHPFSLPCGRLFQQRDHFLFPSILSQNTLVNKGVSLCYS